MTTDPTMLWERFQRECPAFLDNAPHTRRDAALRARVLLSHFGEQLDVTALTPHDVAMYAAARKRGGISVGRVEKGGKEVRVPTRPVHARTVHADLVLLRQMLRWACTVSLPNHSRLLDRNPLDGLRIERERNPKRPVATFDAFEAVLDGVQKLAGKAPNEAHRARWTRLAIALILAEATGRRRGAIAALRWEDVDFERGTIRWRAEHDKTRVERVVPVTPELCSALRRHRSALGTISGPIFPSRKKPAMSMPPEILDQWLRAAARLGELPPMDGSGFRWHALRRKWATERKHLPLPDVMAAGGWKDSATLLTAYQHADDETMLRVMAHPAKLVRVGKTPNMAVARNGTRNSTTWGKTREPDSA